LGVVKRTPFLGGGVLGDPFGKPLIKTGRGKISENEERGSVASKVIKFIAGAKFFRRNLLWGKKTAEGPVQGHRSLYAEHGGSKKGEEGR